MISEQDRHRLEEDLAHFLEKRITQAISDSRIYEVAGLDSASIIATSSHVLMISACVLLSKSQSVTPGWIGRTMIQLFRSVKEDAQEN